MTSGEGKTIGKLLINQNSLGILANKLMMGIPLVTFSNE
jgi:hypothetical protein